MTHELIIQRIFFFILMGILAVLTLILVWQFITPILLAFAVVVIIKPVYTWLLGKRWIHHSETRATGATLVIFVLIIAIPVIVVVGGAISQASSLFSGLELESLSISPAEFFSQMETALRGISSGEIQVDQLNISQSIQEAIAAVGEWVVALIAGLGETFVGFMTNFLVVLVIMYVLLPRYNRPGEQDILELVPFPREITQLFLDKIDLMITAMFKGLFVIAIVQGGAMGIVLWIAGVPYVMFFTLLSMLLSLVPFVGISLVAWPVGILLIVAGNVWQGVFVILAFLLIVANIDTALRPFLVPKGAYLNPALVILSVFGGLSVMGIIGIIYGPVIMILLITGIEVYAKYMLRDDLVALQNEGRIDLKELGLAPEEMQETQSLGAMFTTALKNVSARFRPSAPA